MRLFFFHATATTEIYTLSLHDALPILLEDEHVEADLAEPAERDHAERGHRTSMATRRPASTSCGGETCSRRKDRKSTRLNSSHPSISYAVFCLKKKKDQNGS